MDDWEWLKARLIGWLFIAIIAIPIVALVVVSVAAARRARPSITSTGELVMRYSLPMRLFGIFAGVVVPAIVCGLLFAFVPRDWNEVYAAAGSLLFFLLLGGWLLLETHCVWVRVSDKRINYHSPWRADRVYPWDEISEVSTFSY